MTIEEMQAVWSTMTEKIEKQEHLTNQIIMEMTKEKFQNRIGKIRTIEGVGALVCFIMAFLLLFYFNRLDTWYLMASGIFVFLYLIVAPTLVMLSISRMKSVDIINNSYRDSLLQFTKRRKRFLGLQRLFIGLNFFLIIIILPVSSMIFKGKDLFKEDPTFWIWYTVIMLLFMIPFSFWGYRGYKRMTGSIEQLLSDIRS